VINNVITLATIPTILAKGPDFYRNFGIGGSRGTMPFQLSGNIKQAGLVELAFGPPLATLLNEFGGGTANGRAMKAVQVGGPLGAYLPSTLWHTLLDYEAFATVQAGIGHGGIIAFDDSVDMSEQARFAMEFCAIESCGKCTPCRIGSVRGVEVIDQLARRDVEFEPEDPERQAQKVLLEDLCETMTLGSLCGLGGMTAFPVLSALKHFSEDFD
jgi:formate dehydrogenase iron-sulfur subunit